MTHLCTDTTDEVPRRGMRALLCVPVAMFFILWFTACGDEKKSFVGNVDPEVFPTMRTTDVSTLVSDSGYTRYHLTADLWLMFDEAEDPHWTFPEGLFMERYDDNMEVEATFRSDSAIYFSKIRKWRFDGNVRMRNVEGDRFATEQLFWDQQAQKVYSDSFVHIERIDRIIEGYGFESNEEMTEYTILNVMGIFPTPDKKEKKTDTDTLATVSTGKKTPTTKNPDNLEAPMRANSTHGQRHEANNEEAKITVLKAQ